MDAIGFSMPSDFTNLNGKVYFVALATATQGRELWGTDGTTAGTVLVKDIEATANFGSQPTNLTAFNNLLFFSAKTLAGGYEIYRSDGTSAATVLVSDINSGAASSGPHDLYAFSALTPTDNRLFFGADNGASGDELYSVNPSNVLTLVKDINPGSGSSNPQTFFTFNNKVYFVADDGVHGLELWVSDGTSGGTSLVGDLCSGVCSSHIAYLGSLPNAALLQAFNGTQTKTFFLTASGIQEFQETSIKYPDTIPRMDTSSTEVNGKILITIGDKVRVDLAALDPQTLNFTVLKHFLNITALHGDNSFRFGQKLIFSANSIGGVMGIYISDGTEAGTILLKEGFFSVPGSFMLMGTKVYFTAGTDAAGVELWVTDGTVAGTSMVKDAYVGVSNGITSSGSYNYFAPLDSTRFILRGNNGVNGTELFISDGTSAGTLMLKDIYTGGVNSSFPSNFVALNSKVYFNSVDSAGSKIWVTDGTGAGTVNMTIPSTISNLVPLKATPTFFYAIGFSTTIGNELWRSDGTVAGTTLVKEINPGIGSAVGTPISYEMNYYSSNTGIFYFTADDGITGEELWRSDGTEAGTYQLVDISTGAGDTKFTDVTVELDGKIYFHVQTEIAGATGHAYYVSDGTVAGTKKIMFSKQNYSFPTGYVSVSSTMKSLFVSLADAANVTTFFRFILE